jgi:hypothetical protein
MYTIDTCQHSFCLDCLRQYLKYQIIESRVAIACPQCNEKMHPNNIYQLLSIASDSVVSPSSLTANPVVSSSSASSSPNSSNKSLLNTNTSNDNAEEEKAPKDPLTKPSGQNWSQLINKYEEFMLRRILVTIPDTRWCPAPDCTYAVIASGCANCPQLYCMRPNCNTSFCYHCKQHWHPNLTCEDAALRSNQSLLNQYLSQQNGTDFLFQELTTSGGNNGIASTNTSSTNKLIRSLLQRSNSHMSINSSNNLNTNNERLVTFDLFII